MNQQAFNPTSFLADVFICSLGAYGGPEAHYGVFNDQLVEKKQYVSEEELLELIALTTFLPGPSSTQTIVSIGYKVGGPKLAFLTLLVWSLPVIFVMTALSFMWRWFASFELFTNILRFIGPMAVGFIAMAAIRLGKKIIKNRMSAGLFLFGLLSTLALSRAWMYPLVLLLGGVVAVIASQKKHLFYPVAVHVRWKYVGWFLLFAMGSSVLAIAVDSRLLTLFEKFYRFGYLVIGGGQVVIPMMFTELVETNQWMSSTQFLTGYGLVQGLPGPMFSFAAYAGGISAVDQGPMIQVISALLSGIAIFLPGTLLIFFVYPIWENLKVMKGISVALIGVTAVATGLIATSAITLFMKIDINFLNLSVLMLTMIVLASKRVSAPIVVVGVLLLGILL